MARRALAAGIALGAVLAASSACAPHTPRVVLPALTPGVGPFLDAHPLGADQAIRIDEVGRTAGASYHLVQVRGQERPHHHAAHDLTVLVLRGHGMLTLGGDRLPLAAGDAAVVPRGLPHWFANEGREASVTFAVFTPPLDAPDSVPEGGR